MNTVFLLAGVVWREVLRRKDVYVLFILLAALLLALLSVNAFGLASASRYVRDLGLLLAWLFSLVLTLTVTARQLPQEEQRGTIFTLLAKPVGRGQLVLGKWLGCWTVGAAATGLFYLLLAAVAAVQRAPLPAATALQAFGLHAALLGMVAALTLALSTRLTHGAALTLGAVLAATAAALLPAIPRLAGYADRLSAAVMLALYYALPHLELFDLRRRLVHDWGPAPAAVVAGVAAYGLAWVAIFLLAAWLGYRRKYFQRATP